MFHKNTTAVFHAAVAFLDLLAAGNEKGDVEQLSGRDLHVERDPDFRPDPDDEDEIIQYSEEITLR